jgi:hypothetical protein
MLSDCPRHVCVCPDCEWKAVRGDWEHQLSYGWRRVAAVSRGGNDICDYRSQHRSCMCDISIPHIDAGSY